MLRHFNEFVLTRGVTQLQELPNHVDAFIEQYSSGLGGRVPIPSGAQHQDNHPSEVLEQIVHHGWLVIMCPLIERDAYICARIILIGHIKKRGT